MNVIEIKNVAKDYGDFKLDNISFEVPEGSVCGFIGQNGAGKTTTIKMILDVIEEDHTILLSSHITGDLEKLADEVVFINGGKIVLAGNKDDILEKHGLLKCKKNELKNISASFIVNAQPGAFGVEALVNDRDACVKRYPEMVIEQASLEDIMLFYVNKSISGANGKASDVSDHVK